MNGSVIAALSLGFWLGIKHALDADHLVAVSTIVSEHKSLWRSSIIGTFWGLGHTASLLGVGLFVVLLRITVSPSIAPFMEIPVSIMLIALGANAVWQAWRERGISIHIHAHAHEGQDAHKHLHLHTHKEHDHKHHLLRLGRKPFMVGLVHGFAGSAVLMIAVLTTMPTVALGLIYIAVFGLGSVGGMLLMSALISLPFVATAKKFSSINNTIRLLAGIFSVAFGLMLAWDLLHEILSRQS
ncbi:MAG: urease accessory protein UreH [Acidobacteria bacterium]|nr:urease accessory protein UreH [Acidobacteriota bacterium]